jgi:hypothetical protein
MKKNEAGVKKLIILPILLSLIGLVFSQIPKKSTYYSHYYFLSKSLVKGKLNVADELKMTFTTPAEMEDVFDFAVFKGKYFLHLGVFPAIIGIPFSIFGPESYTNLLVIIFLLLNLLLIAKIGNHYLKQEAFSISLLLFIASPLLTTLVWRGPWYLAGLIISALGFLFLWFYEVKKKDWAVFLIGSLALTRPTTIFYAIIPFWQAARSKKIEKRKIIFLALTIAAIFLTLFSYNYLRFGNIFEFGYRYGIVPWEEFRKFRRTETSVKDYFLSNIIYMFINPPRAHLNEALRFSLPYFELARFGVGLIFIMPWFLLYLFQNKEKRRDRIYWLTILLIALAILSYRSEGDFQIGSRYACDFFPLLAFINFRWLAKNKKNIPFFKKLLTLSFTINFYFFFLIQLGYGRRI